MKLIAAILAASSLVLAAAEPPPTLAIGSQAPAFALPGTDGKTHRLTDFAASRVLVVIFTCNHCPDANAAAPRMAALDARYRDKGVAFVAISGNHPAAIRPDELGYSPYDDSFDDMKPFAAENGWQFPYLYDGDKQDVTTAYGAQATPHVFVFDETRTLRYTGRMDDNRRKFGPAGKSYLADAIDALLNGAKVNPETTRPFGCSTKWIWKRDSVAKDQEKWESLPVTLETLDAKTAAILRQNTTAKLRVINLWSTTCGPCVSEFPELVETSRRFQNRPVEVVTISLDPIESKPAVLEFLKSRHAALPAPTAKSLKKESRTSNHYIYQGNPDHLAEAIDPDWQGALPLTVVVAPGGELVWRTNDEVDPFTLRSHIVKWLRQSHAANPDF
ncbi:MAG: redoxin domain-containing protein [Verrucomicrobiales bacterium]